LACSSPIISRWLFGALAQLEDGLSWPRAFGPRDTRAMIDEKAGPRGRTQYPRAPGRVAEGLAGTGTLGDAAWNPCSVKLGALQQTEPRWPLYEIAMHVLASERTPSVGAAARSSCGRETTAASGRAPSTRSSAQFGRDACTQSASRCDKRKLSGQGPDRNNCAISLVLPNLGANAIVGVPQRHVRLLSESLPRNFERRPALGTSCAVFAPYSEEAVGLKARRGRARTHATASVHAVSWHQSQRVVNSRHASCSRALSFRAGIPFKPIPEK